MGNNDAMRRIESLLDANSFVEFGEAVLTRSTDFNISSAKAATDGVITGHGLINGNLVFVYSQDGSVLGGSIGEMHAKKIARMYEMAVDMGAPVIGLLDSSGVRLEESYDAMDAIASIYKAASVASGIVPQITAVFGNCGGGLSVLASISDFCFMCNDAKLFIGTPNTIPGNHTDSLDTASADFKAACGEITAAGSEDEVIASIKNLINIIPDSNLTNGCIDDCTDDLNRASNDLLSKLSDTSAFAAEISDSNMIFEYKKAFGSNITTAFIKLDGITVAFVGNNESKIDADAASKAAEFISFADAYGIPVLSVINTDGFEASVDSEKRLGTSVAKMIYSFASATVPKITLYAKDAYSSAYLAMNPKSLGADVALAFTNAGIAPMKVEDAKSIISDVATYQANCTTAANAASRGVVDKLIDPVDTRKYLIANFEMLLSKAVPMPNKKHGTK